MGDFYSVVKTYSPDNMFYFDCPIFGSEQRLRDCLALRDEWVSGKRVPGREGCLACLSSSKCPIVPIMRDVLNKGADPYYSRERTRGSLDARHVDMIRNVVVTDYFAAPYNVPAEQWAAIQSAHKRLMEGSKVAKSSAFELSVFEREEAVRPPRKRKVEEETRTSVSSRSATNEAAITGDFSAALNAAMASAESVTVKISTAASVSAPIESNAPKLSLMERARLRREGKL